MKRIKDLCIDERPRERLQTYGADKLSNIELLAIIIETGYKNESSLDLAKEILSKEKSITSLREITISELRQIKGIGLAKAIKIISAIELGKRAMEYEEGNVLDKAKTVYEYIKNKIGFLSHEEFHCLYVDSKIRLIKDVLISQGGLQKSLTLPREIFKWAVKETAAGIILVHNHPSNDSNPSISDIESTKKLINIGSELGIPILDHVIVCKNNYFSFNEAH